ncbi:MAG: type II toxin-antitoxin system VapC family toxin [Phycisphaerae bacterium]
MLDTNILTRSIQPASGHHAVANVATGELLRRGDDLCVVPQVIYEFWVVCTRPPGDNGLGMDADAARLEIDRILSVFTLLPDEPTILPVWRALVTAHQVHGKSAHDARLVAAMDVHGMATLMTFNGTHFRRFPGVTVLDPITIRPSVP